MNINDVRKLQAGDEVFWTDPDDDLCSRHYTIQYIEYIDSVNDDSIVVCITDYNGSYLECFASELS
jgi:hypothetical protein